MHFYAPLRIRIFDLRFGRLVAHHHMLQFQRSRGECYVTLATLLQTLPSASQLAQQQSRNGFHSDIGLETVFDQHVPIVLVVIAQILVTAHVVIPISDT